jgi:pectate lyase
MLDVKQNIHNCELYELQGAKGDIKMKTLIFFISLLLCFVVLSTTSVIAIPSFPGAEGYGANTIGGRGGRLIEVTNLNDSGPGSLREACESSGPRIVVFRVGGTIQLNSDIKIEDPYITIAGQTAPGDGITLRNGTLKIGTNDVIIRSLRIRVGSERGEALDGIAVLGGKVTVSNVIIDHCSVSWGVDENVSTYGEVHDVTFQWCIISEGLYYSTHSKDVHSMGMRVGKNGFNNVSIHHNLFAHNNQRQPQVSTSSETEIINNVVYNWGDLATRVKSDAKSNIIGNYYKAGPSLKGDSKKAIILDGVAIQVFVTGNIGPDRPEIATGDDWLIVDGFEAVRSYSPVVLQSGITTHSADEAYSLVLNNAGVISPKRDSVDIRIVQTIIDNEGPRTKIDGSNALVDYPHQVGGWPALASGVPPLDTDHDGMPDAWEIVKGLNPNDSTDASADMDGDGYTNVEEYINELIPVINDGSANMSH